MTDATLMSAVFVGIIAGFYFMFMRPAQKENERHRQQIRDLRPGDDVLTTSGFIATVKDIQVPEQGQTRIKLEMAEGIVFTAVTSAIAQRLAESGGREKQTGASG
jgi:preprotein translocase subunit YajC